MLDKIMPANAKKAVDAAKQAVAGGQAATTADISKVFQPSREVVVVTDRDRLINDPNRPLHERDLRPAARHATAAGRPPAESRHGAT